jgi:peptidoglycan/xylan/chitin deacetylase (PgdA/CDA1 family)
MFDALHKQIPILAYHAIASAKDAELPNGWSKNHAVLLESFRSHLEFMRAAGWRALLPDAMEAAGRLRGEKHFILTFDDGHASDVIAAETMKLFGYRAIFYVPWEHVGLPGFLGSAEIAALAADGFAIGSHGMTHSPLTQKTDPELRDELFESKVRLEDLIGRKVEDLALPFGRYDRRVIAMARAAGYRRIMTSNIGLARTDESRVFPRFPVTSRTSLEDFLGMLLAGPVGMMRRRLLHAISRRLMPPRNVFNDPAKI